MKSEEIKGTLPCEWKSWERLEESWLDLRDLRRRHYQLDLEELTLILFLRPSQTIQLIFSNVFNKYHQIKLRDLGMKVSMVGLLDIPTLRYVMI